MKGFSLIELLVVIAIIGIVFSVVLTATNAAKKSARDSQRQSDLSKLQSALQSFYADHSYYPVSLGSGACNLLNCSGIIYLNNLPTDPVSGNAPYCYQPLPNASCSNNPTGGGCSCDNSSLSSNCNAFNIVAQLESPTAGSSTYACGTSTLYNFKVTQPQ